MQYNEETLNLRDGACVLTIKSFNVADVRSLSDEQLFALAEAGVEGWKYRGAVKQNKTDGYVNNGKTFGLGDIVADLLATPTRSSGPSAKDKADAEKVMKVITAGVSMPAPLPKDADQSAIDTWRAEVRAAIKSAICAKADAKMSQYDWLSWEYNDSLTAMENVTTLVHALRTQQPKQKKPSLI